MFNFHSPLITQLRYYLLGKEYWIRFFSDFLNVSWAPYVLLAQYLVLGTQLGDSNNYYVFYIQWLDLWSCWQIYNYKCKSSRRKCNENHCYFTGKYLWDKYAWTEIYKVINTTLKVLKRFALWFSPLKNDKASQRLGENICNTYFKWLVSWIDKKLLELNNELTTQLTDG